METATKAFIRNADEFYRLLESIREKIGQHDCRKATWPQVGSLEHVVELLRQADEAMNWKR